MSDVWTMGELLVEVMRPKAGMSLGETGAFVGPFPSGAPGIFIDTVARLGHSASIVSGVGEDDFGQLLLNRLSADGVRTDHIEVISGKATGVAFVTYQRDGSRRFIFHWDGTPAVMATPPKAGAIRGARYFHVMGCSLMANDVFRTRVYRTVERFVRAGAAITFDPNIRFELLSTRGVDELVDPILEHCSVLFPGESELKILAREASLARAIKAMFRRYPLELIVLKRGSRGCTVYEKSGRVVKMPAYRVRETDPTGAGDCFDGGFVCGLLEGRDIRECAAMASACGALNAQAFGPMEGKISAGAIARLMRQPAATAVRQRRG